MYVRLIYSLRRCAMKVKVLRREVLKSFKKAVKLNQDSKGFTLIELAIVLVIIGIIIALVLKGQDMIQSTRIKQAREMIENGVLRAFIDCYGNSKIVPGDVNGDRIIDTTNDADPFDPAACTTGTCKCFQENPVVKTIGADHHITIGDKDLYIYIGTEDTPNACGSPNVREHVLVVCPAPNCTGLTLETADPDRKFYIRLAQDMDSDLDLQNEPVGVVNDTDGYILGGSVTVTNGIVTGITPDDPGTDTNPDWEGTETAIIYCITDLR